MPGHIRDEWPMPPAHIEQDFAIVDCMQVNWWSLAEHILYNCRLITRISSCNGEEAAESANEPRDRCTGRSLRFVTNGILGALCLNLIHTTARWLLWGLV